MTTSCSDLNSKMQKLDLTKLTNEVYKIAGSLKIDYELLYKRLYRDATKDLKKQEGAFKEALNEIEEAKESLQGVSQEIYKQETKGEAVLKFVKKLGVLSILIAPSLALVLMISAFIIYVREGIKGKFLEDALSVIIFIVAVGLISACIVFGKVLIEYFAEKWGDR